MQIVIGIGGKLQEPCLLQGQELNGGKISRLFAQKIIWLRHVSDTPNTFFLRRDNLTTDNRFTASKSLLYIIVRLFY